MLGWSARDFWESTPADLGAAIAGRARSMQPRQASGGQMGDDGIPLAPGCTREGVQRVLAEMRSEQEV